MYLERNSFSCQLWDNSEINRKLFCEDGREKIIAIAALTNQCRNVDEISQLLWQLLNFKTSEQSFDRLKGRCNKKNELQSHIQGLNHRAGKIMNTTALLGKRMNLDQDVFDLHLLKSKKQPQIRQLTDAEMNEQLAPIKYLIKSHHLTLNEIINHLQ
jgi:hypothetical protein